MSTNANKMDSSEVYSMFESIKELIIKKEEKQPEKQVEPAKVKIDTTALNAITERIEFAAEKANKPTIVKHQHKIEIDIQSNWFFLSWVILVLIIGASFWALADQRETINQYKENDLKYRYIKMQGKTDEENLQRLENQFQYGDSIKIIHKQVERFEKLVKEQAERIERAKQNGEEAKKLKEEVESLKSRK